jgi:hypothetical protein
MLFFIIFIILAFGFVVFAMNQLPQTTAAGKPALLPSCIFGLHRDVVFYAFFLVFGLLFLAAMLLEPLLKVMDARHWKPAPCTIISSRVESHSDGDGDTYSVKIAYRYFVNNKEYTSDCYQFMGGSTSGRESKAAIVRRYPPGLETNCYVNPKNVTEAVLNPDLTSDMWYGLIPLLFAGIGLGGIIHFLVKRRR